LATDYADYTEEKAKNLNRNLLNYKLFLYRRDNLRNLCNLWPTPKKFAFLAKNTVILCWNPTDKVYPIVCFISYSYSINYKFSITFSDLRRLF